MPAATASLVRVCSTMGMEMKVITSKNRYIVTMVPESVSAIREPRVRR